MPRLVPAQRARACAGSRCASPLRAAPSSALQSSPRRWPVAVVSPGRSALISRSAHRIQAERLGDAVHVHFDGELRLRRAEAAERAVRRRVGHHRAAADAHVVAAIRAASRGCSPRDSTTALSVAYAPPSSTHVDVHRRQPAVARHAGAMPDDRRDGAWSSRACPRRGRRRASPAGRALSASSAACPAIIDGYSSLPPKPPPVSVWTTRTWSSRQPEQHLQRLVHVVRALHRAVDRDAAVLRARRSRRSARCRAAPGGRCGTRLRRRRRPRRSRASRSPLSIAIVLNDGVDARDRRSASAVAVVDARPSAASSRSRSSCASSRIGSATCRIVALGQARLVVVDQRDDVAARDVAVSRRSVKPARVEVETDAGDLAARESSSGWCARAACRETRGRRCTSRAPVTFASPSLRRTLRPTALRIPDYTSGSCRAGLQACRVAVAVLS